MMYNADQLAGNDKNRKEVQVLLAEKVKGGRRKRRNPLTRRDGTIAGLAV